MTTLTVVQWMEGETRIKMRVKGGLHYLKGNTAPYFSITGEGYENGREAFGGCCHDEILKHCPQYADLVALHLSDMDGAPMYAVENGFFHLGGTHFNKPNYKGAASHLRITEDEARALVRDLFGDSYSLTGGFLSSGAAKQAKARFAAWVDTQRPRWKAEADAAINKHSLTVYGDEWQAA
jgi:hypothetical protein